MCHIASNLSIKRNFLFLTWSEKKQIFMWRPRRWEQVLLVSFLHCSHRSCVCEIFLKAQNASEKHERNFNKIKSMISANFFSQLSSYIDLGRCSHLSTKFPFPRLIDWCFHKKKMLKAEISLPRLLYQKLSIHTTDIIAFDNHIFQKIHHFIFKPKYLSRIKLLSAAETALYEISNSIAHITQ